MLPKLYRTSHPRAPYRVVFTAPDGKTVARHFKDPEKAKTYHRELLAKAKVVGTVGLVMDQEMRAEYFAARQLLDGVPLLTAVRYFLSHRPVGLAATPLADALKAFIRDKQRSGRAERTVRSLDSTISAFLAESSARLVSDFTREAVTTYLDGLSLPSLTLRNHRARLSTFGGWLARRQYLRKPRQSYRGRQARSAAAPRAHASRGGIGHEDGQGLSRRDLCVHVCHRPVCRSSPGRDYAPDLGRRAPG